MLHAALVPASDIVGVALVKAEDMEVLFIKAADKLRIFDDKDEPGRCFPQRRSQPLLILFCKGAALIVGKIRVIGRIKEHEIPLRQMDMPEKVPKIHAAKLRVGKQLPHLIAENMVDFCAHILLVVGFSTIGDVELPVGIVAEHGAIAILTDEIEVGGPVGGGGRLHTMGLHSIVKVPEVHIVAAGKAGDQICLQVLIGKGLF